MPTVWPIICRAVSVRSDAFQCVSQCSALFSYAAVFPYVTIRSPAFRSVFAFLRVLLRSHPRTLSTRSNARRSVSLRFPMPLRSDTFFCVALRSYLLVLSATFSSTPLFLGFRNVPPRFYVFRCIPMYPVKFHAFECVLMPRAHSFLCVQFYHSTPLFARSPVCHKFRCVPRAF